MMWKQSFLMSLLSVSALNAALADKNRTETNICFPGFASPRLDSKTNVVMKGQNVSLICSNQNKSLQIIYSLFRNNQYLRAMHGQGEPVIFNLSITKADELGSYKCKANISNCMKYSNSFNFTFVDPVTTPVLNVNVIRTKTDLYITLHCISFNGSLPINYTFFETNSTVSPVISKYARAPAQFNLTKSNIGEVAEYRCKAENRVPNHAKYSQPSSIPPTGGRGCPWCLKVLLPGLLLVLIVITLILAFRILPKHKARKAMKDKVPRDYENTPIDAGLYANIYKTQADKESAPGLEPRLCVSTAQDETGHSQEIHYATPIFQEVKPKNHEACNDGKTRPIYSELNFEI